MNNFDRAFEMLLGNEGAYSNHPNDPGGETMWGITIRTARNWGYTGEMIDLPVETAKLIYKSIYWNDMYNILPYIVAFNVFDAAVNHGPRTAIKFLQRAVNVNVDGVVGNNTISAILLMNPYEVAARFNAERLSFYTNLKTWRTFGKGWTNRVVNNLKV